MSEGSSRHGVASPAPLIRRVGPSWRAVIMVLVATAASVIAAHDQPASGAAGSVAPAATAARWVSCPGLGFYPAESSQTYESAFYGRKGGGIFGCALDLPHGATVTAVKFHLRDADANKDISNCYVARVKLDPPSETLQVLAGPKGTSGAPGDTTLTDTSIDHAVVNDHYWAYWANCTIEADTSALEIIGVTVRYKP